MRRRFARDEFRSLLVEVDLEEGVHDGKPSRPVPKSAGKPSRRAPCRFWRDEDDPSSKFRDPCRRPRSRI